MMNDKCSIIIPAYNQADKTVRAVESCLKQTYPCEVIVVDDGSTDETIPKIQAIEGIICILQKNQGCSNARNTGIAIATGKYIAFLDCDDYYELNKIELSIAYLNCYRQCMFVHTNVYVPGLNNISGEFETKVWLEPGWVEKKPKIGNLLFKNYIFNSTPVIRRSWMMDNLFDESLFIAADWDMWLRLSETRLWDINKEIMIDDSRRIGYLDLPLTYIGGLKFPKRVMRFKDGQFDTLGTLNQGFREPLQGVS